ncbi:MAG: hypothetical protein C0432_04600 [Candidatus Puniceispirillum sp.]|nr:hypothetical protein [Candidatus Pelagibacter sp.]MBA4283556.1 hypothetical protein [Candidatus Puniceispirillum sp.]
MKKFILFSLFLQSFNLCHSSTTPFDLTTNPETSIIIHRPINVSNVQGYSPQPFTITGDGTNVLVHNVCGDGDCLFYALGISEPHFSLRDHNHPWDTKNRTFALMAIAKKRDHFHPSALYKLSLILKSHLDVFDDQRLYQCYPSAEVFNLAMTYRLSKAGLLNDFLNGTEQGQQLKNIFSTVNRDINIELLDISDKKNRSIQLLKQILQLKSPGKDLNSFIKEKLKSSFSGLVEISRNPHFSQNTIQTREFRSLCFQAFSFIMSTRLYISDEFCTFLAPVLGKNILVWTKTGRTVTPNTYYPVIDVTKEFTECTDCINTEFGKTQLRNPNTYHILYDEGHFQILTSADTVVTYDSSWERAKACAEKNSAMEPTVSNQYDISKMTEEEQMAAALSNSLKF